MYLYVDQPLEKSLCQKKLEMIFPFLYPQAIFWASHSSDARLCAELGMSGSAQHCHRPQLQQGAQEFSSALTAQVPEQLSAQLRAPQPFQPGFLRQQSARLLNNPPLSLLFQQFPPWWAISAKPEREQKPRRQSPRGNKGYRKGVHTNRHLGAHVGTGHRSSQGTEKPLIVTHWPISRLKSRDKALSHKEPGFLRDVVRRTTLKELFIFLFIMPYRFPDLSKSGFCSLWLLAL